MHSVTGNVEGALPGTLPLGQGGTGAEAAPSALPTGQEPNQPANPTPDQLTLRGLRQSLPGTPAQNQDVFMDMLLTMRNAREKKKIESMVAAGLTPPKSNGLLPQTGPTSGTLVESLTGGRMMIHSLAGESKDMFNMQMGRAGKDLRNKQYYEAAYAYETAALQDQNNPLAKLGRGLSLLGAGESLTAAYEIERAIKLFPPLSKAQVDLPAIMGSDALEASDRADRRANQDRQPAGQAAAPVPGDVPLLQQPAVRQGQVQRGKAHHRDPAPKPDAGLRRERAERPSVERCGRNGRRDQDHDAPGRA